jgi:hypothetical protein
MYAKGESQIWDWLHCSYPNDKSSGTIMHSYVFKGGKFQGQGFDAAVKVQSGMLSSSSDAKTCEQRFPDEAAVLSHYQSNSTNRVLLFGWLACPCTADAQERFAAASICYESRTWANPNAKLMDYLQCKEGKPEDHSFVYFRNADGEWEFKGNGFMFAKSAMSDSQLASLVAASHVPATCRQASVMVNVFGTPLEECRADAHDFGGSWQDDGTCSEQVGTLILQRPNMSPT